MPSFAAFLICLTVVAPAVGGESDDDATRAAVDAIRQLGGKVVRDEQRPGRPVVEVSLARTKASDQTLDAVGRLKDVRALDLSRTTVTDQGLKALGGMPNLRHLDLALTAVTVDGLQHLRDVQSLQSLRPGDRITAAGLARLTDLPNLQTLHLDGMKVKGPELKQLAAFKGLRDADLSCNGDVADSGLRELANMPGLQSLELFSAQLTDAGVKELAQLHNLRSLSLDVTRRMTPDGLAVLDQLGHLATLRLSGPYLRDEHVAAIGGPKHLRALALSGRITDAALARLDRFPELEELDLWGTRITDDGLAAIRALKRLRSVNLTNTNVTPAGVPSLRAMRACGPSSCRSDGPTPSVPTFAAPCRPSTLLARNPRSHTVVPFVLTGGRMFFGSHRVSNACFTPTRSSSLPATKSTTSPTVAGLR